MDILEEIVQNKRKEVASLKAALPLEKLKERVLNPELRETRSMKAALLESGCGIIAEFKRRSPSKGWLHPDAEVGQVVPFYEKGGAAACSILTDGKYFGGTTEDFINARRMVDLPLLRKDFIIDEYQVYEARLIGADAILLIAAALTSAEECRQLATLAHSLGLEVLLEIHRLEELEGYICPEVDMLGVNNRNLGTFHTEVGNSFGIARGVRAYLDAHPERHSNPVLVSESGISSAETVHLLRGQGFGGFLIGETFMKTAHPGDTLRAFARDCRFILKVCGLRYPDNIRDVLAAGANTVGLIFYPKSPRCVRPEDEHSLAAFLPETDCRKVGVFVNESLDRILELAKRYSLTHIQLHGDETPGFCRSLRGQAPLKVIKAISVDASASGLRLAGDYADTVDYFLFDTKTDAYGGSGRSFDWQMLANYTLPVPFVLSGGLSEGSIGALKSFSHPCWAGIDLNSGVEAEAGLKNPGSIRTIINSVFSIKQTK